MIRARQECDARREEHLKELMQERSVYEDTETRINIEHLERLYGEESDNSREGIFGRALAETCEEALEGEDPEEESSVVLYHPGGTERYWRPGDAVYGVFEHLLEGAPEDEEYGFLEVEFEDRDLRPGEQEGV